MKSARLFLALVVTASLWTAGASAPSPPSSEAAHQRFRLALRDATRIELLSLIAFPNPKGWGEELFHGWPVHGRVSVSVATDVRLLRPHLSEALRVWGPTDSVFACFLPGHAIVVVSPRERVEALIAFDCGSAYIFVDRFVVQGLIPDPALEAYLSKRFDAAGIKREPSLMRRGPA